jgi:hypothetical protein
MQQSLYPNSRVSFSKVTESASGPKRLIDDMVIVSSHSVTFEDANVVHDEPMKHSPLVEKNPHFQDMIPDPISNLFYFCRLLISLIYPSLSPRIIPSNPKKQASHNLLYLVNNNCIYR